MSPSAVDEDRMQGKGEESPIISLNPHNPPTKPIPHAEFPRVVYKHPREPFKTIEHRNARHELVEEEIVPTEHLTRTVADSQELEKALAEGWVKEPYVQKAPPDKSANLYDDKRKK